MDSVNLCDNGIYACYDNVLKILDSVLVNYLGVELNFLEYLCTAHCNFNHTACGRSCEISCLKLSLYTLDVFLHLLSLLYHAVHVVCASVLVFLG